ncbi:MAG: regulatory protein RecX [Ignavibacteria bacterium]|jgi:regulatory protein
MKLLSVTKKGKYVLLRFDNDLECKINEEVFIENKIKRQDNVSNDQVKKLISENEFYNAKNSALRSLSRRSHSTDEIKIKLKQKEYKTKTVDKVINYLEKINFLDDEKFAAAFYLDRLKNKKDSSQKIKLLLYKKGISREIISGIEANYYDENQLLVNAIEAAKRKLKFINKSESEIKTKRKLYSFLKYKGFNDQIISSVFSELKLN